MASTGSPENSSAEEDDLDDDLSSVHSFDTSTPRRSSIRSSISQTVRKVLSYLFIFSPNVLFVIQNAYFPVNAKGPDGVLFLSC